VQGAVFTGRVRAERHCIFGEVQSVPFMHLFIDKEQSWQLVPAWRVGKRTQGDARKFIQALKNRLDAHLPFFTSDDLPHYADALLDGYGEWDTPPRRGPRGRWPAPRQRPPTELCYAVVIKEREGSQVVQVTTPAMAAGLTHHVWTMDELLSFRVPPKSQWE
jgi:hypothetical protein